MEPINRELGGTTVHGIYDMFISLQTLEVIPDLRNPVYMTSCFKAVNLDVILQLMSKVSWDVRDVKSQHSQYVDVLLRVSNI